MYTLLRNRLHKDEEGFSLTELMVVVLILGILMAIAVPTFMGAQNKAKDSSTKSDLRNALTAAKSLAVDDAGEFDTVTVAALNTSEGVTSFAAVGTDALIGVTSAADYILLYKESAGGNWYGVATTRTGHVGYCQGAAITNVNAATVTGTTTVTLATGCTGTKWT